MFGYIRPKECELRVREQTEYRAFYCGLCLTIGRCYGQFARLALNYDCAFLAALLAALDGTAHTEYEQRCCVLGPVHGKKPVVKPSAALMFAADTNILLSYYQFMDDWADEQRLSALLGKLLLKKSAKRAAAKQPALEQAIQRQLRRLHTYESSCIASTDEPSDAFGTLLKEIVLHAPMLRDEDHAAVGWMFYNLGRWIYLIDAWHDRKKDLRHGQYNSFLCADLDVDTASFLLNVSLTEAEKGYDLLPIGDDDGLLNNIMRDGCRHVTQQILGEGDRH